MQKMLVNVIFLCSLLIVTASEISYTKESFSLEKAPCMTDCMNNECVLGFSKKTGKCNPGSTPGLQYYTARDRTQNKLCKSRCGKFDNSTDDWCYVSDNEWDYCNPTMGTEFVKHKAFTKRRGPCKNECKHSRTFFFAYIFWCDTYWGDDWDYCNPVKFTYMHTKTRQGLDCVGICGAHDGKDYNWCVSSEEKEARCAPIARNFTIFHHMFDQLEVPQSKDSCHMKVYQPSYKHRSVPSGFVSRYAELLEYPNTGLLTEYLNEDGHPITAHTIMPYAIQNDPTLPILVRARVTPQTIQLLDVYRNKSLPFRVRQNLQRLTKSDDKRKYPKGEDGHIISYILGGPSEVYNFVAPTHRQHIPEWYDTELLILDFILRTNGWAKITVVIVYSDISQSWIPDGYAVDFTLYNHDNTLHRECNDYYYSNRKND